MDYRNKQTFLPRMEKRPPFSFEVPNVEKLEGETLPRRNIRCKDGLITQPDPSVKTAYDIVTYSANKFGNAKCVGAREVISIHKEKKKVKKMVKGKETEVEKEWSYFELGPYKYLSFVEFQQLAGTLGAGLKKVGLETGDKVHLYGATRFAGMMISLLS